MLTRHKEGSFRELWAISFPLMLTSLSAVSMMFVDRLFIAHLSIEAFSAIPAASTYGWAFILGSMALTGVSEVFVAQYNGAGQKEKLGEPVWQMIWLALGMTFLFLPFSYWGGSLFFRHETLSGMQREYFEWMMLYAPVFPLYGALAGFFIGQGKVKTITWLAFVANFVNAGLDWIMIFGIPGTFPAFGIKGAAIATCSSQLFQTMILLYLFLKQTNHVHYGTRNYSLQWNTLSHCIRIGFPAAAFVILEMCGWALYYQFMEQAGELHNVVAGIVQSLVILLYFFSDGVRKGVTTLVANFIGAKKEYLISSTISSGVALHVSFFLVILTSILLFRDKIIALFLNNGTQIHYLMDETLTFCLATVAFYHLFEGIRFVYAGVLTAAGDTFFLLISGCFTIWIFLITPVYFAVVKYGASVETSCVICACFTLLCALLNITRYKQGRWKLLVLNS